MATRPLIYAWASSWSILFALYLLLVDKVAPDEIALGAFASGLAASGAVVSQGAARARFRSQWSWFRVLARIPGRVLMDCAVVFGALFRRLVLLEPMKGRFREVPFHYGGNRPVSSARRALVTAGVSLAPNTFVVAIDGERGHLLVHQLVPSAKPPGNGDTEWPL